ncbi:unnamed protein product [Dibothriocephalus latus]|uniref:Uncharacterized protein n=1 Tax=Dibothriocephalus latus TaxID=60516 RepID=A0A3P7LNV9_DIBLA|nr:unnamed protein product [Dibothriocephalus latus]
MNAYAIAIDKADSIRAYSLYDIELHTALQCAACQNECSVTIGTRSRSNKFLVDSRADKTSCVALCENDLQLQSAVESVEYHEDASVLLEIPAFEDILQKANVTSVEAHMAQGNMVHLEDSSAVLEPQALGDLAEEAKVTSVEDEVNSQTAKEIAANLDESCVVLEPQAFEDIVQKATATTVEDELKAQTEQEPVTYMVKSSIVPNTQASCDVQQKFEVISAEDTTGMDKIFPVEFSDPLNWLPVVGGDQPAASNPTRPGGELDNAEMDKVFPIEFSDPLEWLPPCGDQLVAGTETRPSGEFDSFAQEPCEPPNMLVRIASGTHPILPPDYESQTMEQADQSTS